MPPFGLHEWCFRSFLFAAGVDVPKEGLEEVGYEEVVTALVG